jgi:hypothetical protein
MAKQSTHLDACDRNDVVVARHQAVGAQVAINLLHRRRQVFVLVDLVDLCELAERIPRENVDERV